MGDEIEVQGVHPDLLMVFQDVEQLRVEKSKLGLAPDVPLLGLLLLRELVLDVQQGVQALCVIADVMVSGAQVPEPEPEPPAPVSARRPATKRKRKPARKTANGRGKTAG